jgi:hypothetical protein
MDNLSHVVIPDQLSTLSTIRLRRPNAKKLSFPENARILFRTFLERSSNHLGHSSFLKSRLRDQQFYP